MSHNAAETTRNIGCAKDESVVDHSTGTRFSPVTRTSTIKEGQGKPKNVNEDTVLQEKYRQIRRVDLSILHPGRILHLADFGKNIWNDLIVPLVTKI